MEKAIHFSIRNATHTLWHQRNSHQQRAILFILVFAGLLCTWIFSSDSTVSGATILYQQMSEPSWSQLVADVPQYHIVAVADNDERNRLDSKSRDRVSALAQGTLHVQVAKGKPSFRVEWGATSVLTSGYRHEDRGLELSTLQYWNGAHLFSCDDRTGIVYEIIVEEGLQPKLVPRHILSDGDGRTTRGMRCEWSTTKGDFLMLGSTGHPWVSDRDGTVVNHHPQWIKTISPSGIVKHIDWAVPYDKMRLALGVPDTGYLLHECGLWSSRWNRWYFIPRHVSNTPYRPGDEHKHGSTAIIIADASFQRVVVNTLGSGTHDTHGLNSKATVGVTDCKFIPNGRDREILLIKTDESAKPAGTKGASTRGFQSYVSIVSTEGVVLMEDTPMPEGYKFEGVELRPIIHSEK